jgi:DNA polymerase, archaea type
MVVWLKQENGHAKRLVDGWTPSIFVAADSRADLEALARSEDVTSYALSTRFVPKYERIMDRQKSEVLEVNAYDAKRLVELARRIERVSAFDAMRIYNADIPPAQTYLYERDLFPLACCDVQETPYGLEWRLLDDAWAYDYVVPKLGRVTVDVTVKKASAIARHSDPIANIELKYGEEDSVIDSGPEGEKILALVELVRDIDPDFVITSDGDTFLFPYLMARARSNGIADRLAMDRDRNPMKPPDRPGTSYFSYGRIYFKPSSIKLYGRVHLDAANSFSYSESGMDGLIEQSRICRQPFHTSSRASIGKALSSLQFYHATKKDILIPWKPTLAEHFKSRAELLVADRGGFIFEPYAGVHEGVAELDFSALYPNIMLKKNISAETVKCSCCPGSSSRVPELGWNVCEKRKGIVPSTMEIIVKKRLR